jgi:hypothetical protein
MKIITALTVISTAFFVAWTRYRLNQWEQGIDQLEAKLLHEPPLGVLDRNRNSRNDANKQSWADLPPIVQRFLSQAVPLHHNFDIRSLRIQQQGEFSLANDEKWVPFTANQLVSTNPPGFVWDARIALFETASSPTKLWPHIQVCDAWADGQTHRKEALMTALTVGAPVLPNGEHLLLLGEALRWLAEAALVPTVLLPEQGLVAWTAVEAAAEGDEEQQHQALLTLLQHPLTTAATTTSTSTTTTTTTSQLKKAQLLVTFDSDTGWLVQVDAFRPVYNHHQEFEMRNWQGHLSEYQEQVDGMWVPTRMEYGWMDENGQLDLYFKGENRLLEFDMIHHHDDRNDHDDMELEEEEETTVTTE